MPKSKRGRPPASVASSGVSYNLALGVKADLDLLAERTERRRSVVMRNIIDMCLKHERTLATYVHENYDAIVAREMPDMVSVYMPVSTHRHVARLALTLGLAPSRVINAAFELTIERFTRQGKLNKKGTDHEHRI